jgi:hypothetical protein
MDDGRRVPSGRSTAVNVTALHTGEFDRRSFRRMMTGDIDVPDW